MNGKNLYANRVAWEFENGPIPSGMLVCHHCDNPSCCRPSHLFLGTPKDNMADMVSKGRGWKHGGAACPRAKLTEEQVLEIRRDYVHGVNGYKRLAKKYGVTLMAISDIVKGHTWK